ncbi:MAG TPA: hypothetical protein VGU66_00180 [Candidatus Elarobacter sp.]|nr:hypothetical protein [Candidatus Elarobacter sp.]
MEAASEYDLAVWEGPYPTSDAEAGQTFEMLYERYTAGDDSTAPTERIAAYVSALLARYPDLTELDDDSVDDSPWADGPLIGNARGPFIYFSFVANDAASEAWELAVSTARDHGLIAFDPQTEALAK